MASNVPVRRVPHSRITIHKDENATARTRSMRSKPLSTNGAATTVTTRAGTTSAAVRSKVAAAKDPNADQDLAAGKRKRSAFGEVVVNKPKVVAKGLAGGKGKDKAVDPAEPPQKFVGVVLKSKTTTTTAVSTKTTTTTTTRAPLRAVTALSQATKRTVRSGTTKPQAPAAEDVMAIDAPAIQAPPRRLSPRKASFSRGRTASKTDIRAPVEEEDIAQRLHKKRRTSSEAPADRNVDTQADVADEMQLAQAELARHVAEIEAEPEADPEGDTWVDLDADDIDDPLMVSEYAVDIFHYLKEVEPTTLPNPNYMENQKDLAWKMRGILTDWLIQVHMRFRLLPETLFLAVNILDRFLSARVVSLAKLQLVGITCMFIGSKVEEIVSPSASDFLRCADSSYTQAEILQAERYILKTLEWNMSFPNPINFLRRASKADGYNVQVRTIAKYLMEIECVEWRLIAAPPSLLAAASIWLSRLMLGYEDWTPNLAHYSSYSESTLVPTANLMLNYILKPIRHPSFYKKYASKKFMKASVFARKWALNRWEEGSQVDLAAELLSVKALIRAARERAIEAGIDPNTDQCEELREVQEGN